MAPKLAPTHEDEFMTVPDADAMAPPEHTTRSGFIEVKTSGKAIAALVLGLCTYLLTLGGIVTAILAIVFGAIARKEIRTHPATLKGLGMATAGMWLGIAFFLLLPLMLLVFAGFIAAFWGP